MQAVVKVITSGSPRLFNPAAAAWYDRYMGAGNYIRLVNNRDVVPSLPLRHTPCAPDTPVAWSNTLACAWCAVSGTDYAACSVSRGFC